MPKQTICLNMIVKNEAPVIRRCVESVRPLIDSWVVVDTGSTDGTQELIRDALRDLPGELHERPWVNFAHNRTEALELARGRADYVLVIDADETIQLADDFAMPELTADVYSVLVRYGGYSYMRRQFLRDGKGWRYEGVLHEYATAPGPLKDEGLPGLTTVPRHDGARARDPLTYRRDALVLEQAHLDDPANARTVFYLAQSYKDAGDLELALRYYRKRTTLLGWDEEVWFSLYQVAQIKERMNAPWPEALEAYLAAYQFRPDRAGPLYRIAMHHLARSEFHVAHVFLLRAMAIAEPGAGRLFVERSLYEYQIAMEYAVTSHYAGDLRGAIETSNALLRGGRLPANAIEQVIRNRRFSVTALVPRSDRTIEPGAIRVVVPLRGAGPELDDCIDSLLAQDDPKWEAILVGDVGDGPGGDARGRIPADDRIAFSQTEPAGGIVWRISAADRLDRSAIRTLRAAFADPGCKLAYGQFRDAAGRLGDAEPASCEEDFASRGASLASRAPAAFRDDATWSSVSPRDVRPLDAVLTTYGSGPPRARLQIAEEGPGISCLMVTLDRLALAKRAIRSYADQRWPNRELVIVTDGTPRFREALERYVAVEGIEGVRVVAAEPGQTLGALRNRSLDEARGEIVCQWDDDDCSHPDRLRVQCQEMLRANARASFLTDHLQLIGEQRVLCWIDWTLGGTRGTARYFPGSLMMFNDPRFRYPVDGPYARQGEDSVLLEQIHAAVPVAPLSGNGHLYLYHYHGQNTFSREHHLHLTNYRAASAHLHANAGKLRDALAYYAIERPVTVVGREGPVFVAG
jgi:glycosyltransferase involved in cell wall biosynthesis